ncbi:MAG TPA: glutamine synthetase beta-grasp domain-containing protein, partial [Anaerolineales bacterium]|nr:glutamine synthetase beta-grasp domain-containing protein [Anaerolineales bacterium]
MDGKDLIKRVKEDNVKFISLQFSDVVGAVKSVDIPARRLNDILSDGAWFDGSSVEGFARIQESDMRLMIDPDTYAALPWSAAESKRARVFCDIYLPNGDPFEGDPRGALKRQIKRIEAGDEALADIAVHPVALEDAEAGDLGVVRGRGFEVVGEEGEGEGA